MSHRIPSLSISTRRRGVETAAWYWLWSGALCLLIVPAARGYSALLGWVGYWLAGAPLVLLAALHWRLFTARLRTALVDIRRRIRRPPQRGNGAPAAGRRVRHQE